MKMDLMRDLPGFKAILKAVLRQQIQQLVEQLSEYTDEETVVLSANVCDGTLSHLGSKTGKIFLETENEIKSRFLGFCLKSNMSPPKQQSENPAKAAAQFFQNSPSIGLSDLGQKRKLETSTFSNSKRYCGDSIYNSREMYKHPQNHNTAGSYNTDRLDHPDLDEGKVYGSGTSGSKSVGHVNDNSDIDLTVVKVEDVNDPLAERQCEVYSKTGNQYTGQMDSFGLWKTTKSTESFPTSQGMSSLSQSGSSLGISNIPYPQLPGMEPADHPWMQDDPQMRMPKVYRCTFCSKVFREKTNLRVHERVHTGEKPYSCGICAKSFAHSSNLRQHERAVHKLTFTSPQYKRQFYNEMEALINAGTGAEETKYAWNGEMMNPGSGDGRNSGTGEFMDSGIPSARDNGNEPDGTNACFGDLSNSESSDGRNFGLGDGRNSQIGGTKNSGNGEAMNSGTVGTGEM